jgi:hypothetical protein
MNKTERLDFVQELSLSNNLHSILRAGYLQIVVFTDIPGHALVRPGSHECLYNNSGNSRGLQTVRSNHNTRGKETS